MANSAWGKITIGGNISQSKIQGLKKAIETESVGEPDSFFNKDSIEIEDFEAPNGQFPNIETFCMKHKICFKRQSAPFDEYSGELVVYIPGVQTTTFLLRTGDRIIMDAEHMMALKEALDIVTLKNAPTYINHNSDVYKDYAKHILSGKSSLEFVKGALDNYVPDREADLPPLKIISGKKKG